MQQQGKAIDVQMKRNTEKSSESSFDITLDETLKALYERRLKIIKILRSLEAEKRDKSGSKLKTNGLVC
jgi:hypothetical protein